MVLSCSSRKEVNTHRGDDAEGIKEPCSHCLLVARVPFIHPAQEFDIFR